MHNPRRKLKVVLFVAIGIIFIGYILFQSKNLLEGPELSITNPQNGESFADPLITISGNAKNIRSITLDDKPISIDNQGNFSDELLLSPGYSIIKLEAEDRFGKAREQFIHVFDSESTSSTAIPLASSTQPLGTTTEGTTSASTTLINTATN